MPAYVFATSRSPIPSSTRSTANACRRRSRSTAAATSRAAARPRASRAAMRRSVCDLEFPSMERAEGLVGLARVPAALRDPAARRARRPAARRGSRGLTAMAKDEAAARGRGTAASLHGRLARDAARWRAERDDDALRTGRGSIRVPAAGERSRGAHPRHARRSARRADGARAGRRRHGVARAGPGLDPGHGSRARPRRSRLPHGTCRLRRALSRHDGPVRAGATSACLRSNRWRCASCWASRKRRSLEPATLAAALAADHASRLRAARRRLAGDRPARVLLLAIAPPVASSRDSSLFSCSVRAGWCDNRIAWTREGAANDAALRSRRCRRRSARRTASGGFPRRPVRPLHARCSCRA